MYRVELKGFAPSESSLIGHRFLMYRVELKDKKLGVYVSDDLRFLMYRVELKVSSSPASSSI